MREPFRRMAIQVHLLERLGNGRMQPIPHDREPRSVGRHFLLAEFASLPESHDQRYRQRAGSHTTLMSTPIHLSCDADTRILFSDIEGADALGSVNLVGAERHEIDAHLLHVDRDLAHALGRIAVKQDALFFCDLSNLLDRVDRPDFVIGEHDGDEDGLVGDRVPDVLRLHHAELVDRQVGDLHAALGFQRFGRVQHRAMLGG